MTGFALLWSKILYSSLWINGSKETRLVWVTLLALKNSEGIIQASVIGLADAAKVTPDECREALRVLLSPDPDDTSKVEDGRRLREIPGGWQIVNHDLYRFSTEAKREYWKAIKADQRSRKKPTKRELARVRAANESREARAVRAELNGDEAAAQQIAAEGCESGAGLRGMDRGNQQLI